MNALDPRAAVDFDVGALDAWLNDWLGGSAPTEVRRTEGGMSNPTYFLQRGDWRVVLRKQPRAELAPSAHAIDREFRVCWRRFSTQPCLCRSRSGTAPTARSWARLST